MSLISRSIEVNNAYLGDSKIARMLMTRLQSVEDNILKPIFFSRLPQGIDRRCIRIDS